MTTEERVNVQTDAVKILRDSIDSKINPDYKISIFDVLSKYVKSFSIDKDGNYGALITGSAVTHALCTSIHNNGLYPDEVNWDFNDVDIIIYNPDETEELSMRLFNYLHAWVKSLNTESDNSKQYIKYSKVNSYCNGATGINLYICGVHMFIIDKLKINLIEITKVPVFFIQSMFDLTINKVYFDGTEINMTDPELVYLSLLTRKFKAPDSVFDQSARDVLIGRIEKYRVRGFDIGLSGRIKITNPKKYKHFL